MSKASITLLERVTFLNARLNPVDGYRVTFTMEDGTVDWIDLPVGQYNKANVDKAIAEKVSKHDAVTAIK